MDLSPDEATLIGCLLVSDAPMYEVAAQCGMSLLEALDIIQRDHCQEALTSARNAARKRFEAKVADAAVEALRTLRETSERAKPHDAYATDERAQLLWAVERRRAATTIIRAATAHQRRMRARPDNHLSETRNAPSTPHRITDAQHTPSVVVEDDNATSPARPGEEADASQPPPDHTRPQTNDGRWPPADGQPTGIIAADRSLIARTTARHAGARHPP